MHIIGDVKDKVALIIDDIIDTGGTLTQAVPALLGEGATEVYAAVTHGVLSGAAFERIQEAQIKKLAVTDTIPLPKGFKEMPNIEVLSVAGLLAESIRRIHNADSISSLFI